MYNVLVQYLNRFKKCFKRGWALFRIVTMKTSTEPESTDSSFLKPKKKRCGTPAPTPLAFIAILIHMKTIRPITSTIHGIVNKVMLYNTIWFTYDQSYHLFRPSRRVYVRTLLSCRGILGV